jgi:hypothetical protein
MFILSSLFACQQPKNYTTLSTNEFDLDDVLDLHEEPRVDVRQLMHFIERKTVLEGVGWRDRG